MIDISTQEILDYISTHGTISGDTVKIIKMNKVKKVIQEHHHYKIWEAKDGRWQTWIEDATKKEGRRRVAKKSLDDLNAFLYDYYTGQTDTLETFYPIWMEHKRLEAKSDLYPDRIDRDWKRFYQSSPIVKVALTDLTPLMLEKWLYEMIKKNHLTKTCFYNMRTILKQALDYAVRLGKIRSNPLNDAQIDSRVLVHPPKKADKDQVFSDKEIHTFSSNAWEDFENPGRKVYRLAPLAALFTFYTGLRVGELTGLKESDIEENELVIQRSVRREDHKVVEPKSYAAYRRIPLTTPAKRIIAAVLEFKNSTGAIGDWLFSEYDRPLPSRIVEEYYQKYCAQLHTSQKSTHCARKTFTSSLIDSGMNINTVRKVVGHTDERTTFKHYAYDRSTSESQLEKLEKATSY
jgi:integrase